MRWPYSRVTGPVLVTEGWDGRNRNCAQKWIEQNVYFSLPRRLPVLSPRWCHQVQDTQAWWTRSSRNGNPCRPKCQVSWNLCRNPFQHHLFTYLYIDVTFVWWTSTAAESFQCCVDELFEKLLFFFKCPCALLVRSRLQSRGREV